MKIGYKISYISAIKDGRFKGFEYLNDIHQLHITTKLNILMNDNHDRS